MNNETGAIAHFETPEDAEEAGYTEPLTSKEALLLRTMNRHERRAELSRMRRERRARARGNR